MMDFALPFWFRESAEVVFCFSAWLLHIQSVYIYREILLGPSKGCQMVAKGKKSSVNSTSLRGLIGTPDWKVLLVYRIPSSSNQAIYQVTRPPGSEYMGTL